MHSDRPIDRTYPVDSFSIGTCLETDEWPCCTGGGNYFTLGKSFTNVTCDKSNNESIVLTCFGDQENVNNPSCKGNEKGVCACIDPIKLKISWKMLYSN